MMGVINYLAILALMSSAAVTPLSAGPSALRKIPEDSRVCVPYKAVKSKKATVIISAKL